MDALDAGVRDVGVGVFAVDPSASSTISATVGGVVNKTTDGGAHWGDSNLGLSVSLLPVTALVIDPVFPSTLYAGSATSSGPLFKSTDAGAHWAPASRNLDFEQEIVAIAPSSHSTLYAGADGVLKSTNGGSTWRYVNNGLAAPGLDVSVSALAVDPTNAKIVYAATRPTGSLVTPNSSQLFKSTDGAVNWRQVPLSLPPYITVMSVVIDPVTPSTLYAATANFPYGGQGGVFKISDRGETWGVSSNGLPAAWVWTLAIDPSVPADVYAATQAGVFRSTDGAASWAPINSGLPTVEVWDLAIDRTGLLLRAPTAAGLFEYSFVPLPPTTTTLVSSINPSTVGQTVTFTATISGSNPTTGTVTFTDGGSSIGGCVAVALAAGQAQCASSARGAGIHSIVASYRGDTGNAASQSTPLSQVVNSSPGSINGALAAQRRGRHRFEHLQSQLSRLGSQRRRARRPEIRCRRCLERQHVARFPDRVEIDFRSAQTIDHVIVYSAQDNNTNPVEPTDTMTFTKRGVTAFDVQARNGSTWITLGSVTGNKLVKRTVYFAATTTSKIRVVIKASAGGRYSFLSEIEAWTP